MIQEYFCPWDWCLWRAYSPINYCTLTSRIGLPGNSDVRHKKIYRVLLRHVGPKMALKALNAWWIYGFGNVAATPEWIDVSAFQLRKWSILHGQKSQTFWLVPARFSCFQILKNPLFLTGYFLFVEFGKRHGLRISNLMSWRPLHSTLCVWYSSSASYLQIIIRKRSVCGQQTKIWDETVSG